jgi:hypothetical protein
MYPDLFYQLLNERGPERTEVLPEIVGFLDDQVSGEMLRPETAKL